jgi:phage-related protein
MATIDTLDIKISAEVTKASKSIEELCTKLNTLSTSLGKINGSAITGLANGVNKLSNAMQGMKNVKTADFTRLATNIEKLGKINTSNLNTVASSMNQIGRGLNAIGNVANLQSVTPAINAIKNLARVDMSGFDVSKLNAMGNALSSFANKMSSVNNINSNVVRLVSSLATLAKSGQYIGNVTTELPRLGTALVSLANNLSSANSIDSSISATIEAIARLANTGEKAAATVSNLDALGNGVVRLLQRLQSAPQLNSNIATTIQGLGNIAANGSRATRSLNAMSTSMTNATKKTKGLASAFGMFYAKMFLVIRGIKKLWSAIESSMDYIEVLNYFDAAFEQVSSNADLSAFQELGYASAEEYANSFQERTEELTEKMTGFTVSSSGTLQSTGQQSLGMNPSETMNYQAMFAQMSSSMGVASDTATKMSQALTMLGADLASVKNLDYADTWDDMASALAGMSRTVDKYGANIRNVNMQQKLNELGIEANITALNQNDKALLRTIILIEDTQYSWGDLADTINQPANQLRLITANFELLGQTIGNLFLPMLQKVLPYINGLVIALQRLFSWFGEITGLTDKLKDTTSAVGGADYSDLLEDTEDLADNLEDAASSAEEYKNQMLGFDEATKLTDSTSSSSSSANGIDDSERALLESAFNSTVDKYQSVWQRAYDNMENRAQELADTIEKSFEPLKNIVIDFSVGDYFKAGQDVSSLIVSLNDFFAQAIASVNWYKIGQNIGGFLSGINWIAVLSSVGKLIWEAINAGIELWKGMFSVAPIETSILGILALPAIVGFGTSLVTLFVNPFKNSFSVISGIISGIGGLFAEGGILGGIGEFFALLTGGAGSVGECFMAVFGVGGIVALSLSALTAGLAIVFATNEEVRDSFFEAANAISDSLQPVIEYFTGTILPDLQGAWERLLEILSPIGDFVGGLFTSIWQDMLNPALMYIGETVIPMLTDVLKNLWENVFVPFGELLDSIFTPIVKVVSDSLTFLWEKVGVPLAKFIGDVFAKTFETLVAVLNTAVIPIVKFLIEQLQELWNGAILPVANVLKLTFEPIVKNVFETIGKVINNARTILDGIIDFVLGIFTNDWSRAWKGVKEIFSGIWNTLKDVVSGVWDSILSLFKNGGKIFSGVVGAISSVFKTIANTIIKGINKVIKIPFDEINGLLNSIRDVTILSVKPFSGLWGKNPLPVPQIPTFKTGGFPEDGLFMANQGELVGKFSNGKTAVANNEQITQGIATAVYNAIRSANATSSNNQQVIKVYVGTKELEDIMIDGINKRTISTGTSPLLI